VLVRASAYRVGVKTSRYDVNDFGLSAAAALRSLADHVESFDQSSSASRQHFIETGRYLTRTDLEG